MGSIKLPWFSGEDSLSPRRGSCRSMFKGCSRCRKQGNSYPAGTSCGSRRHFKQRSRLSQLSDQKCSFSSISRDRKNSYAKAILEQSGNRSKSWKGRGIGSRRFRHSTNSTKIYSTSCYSLHKFVPPTTLFSFCWTSSIKPKAGFTRN